MRPGRTLLVAACLAAAIVPASGQLGAQRPGDPLAGLTPPEFGDFRLGLNEFTEVERADEGLGPAFNGTSCAACHSVPAIGGISPMTEVRAGFRMPNGRFRALDATGNTLFHTFSLPNHVCQPALPPDVNVVARRMPIPLFGAGLVEAIPDDTLLALADPTDRNGDGVAGRASIVTDLATGERRVGRFGWKAQVATLLTFSGDAYRNEMGITNDLFPTELAYGITAEQLRLCDVVTDPEDKVNPATGRRAIDNFASFMRLLAPIARGAIDATVADGGRVFLGLGCATCHVPSLTTGPSANPLFDRRTVPLFSDLLLHDVGTGDGITQSDSTAFPGEIRTPALWGLRFRRPLLHDGSAASLDEAITRHRGEGETARQGYLKATEQSLAALFAFLQSL